MAQGFYIKALLLTLCLIKQAYPEAVTVTSSNADSLLASNELVFLNFYANWCRFSQMLAPIFDEFADKVATTYPQGKVLVGKVDCDQESEFSAKSHINKYPTLKVYRYGVALKKEYRGARSVDAFVEFIKNQIENPTKIVNKLPEFNQVEYKKRTIVGYFENEQSESHKTFLKLASMLRDSCNFVAAVGPEFGFRRPNGDNIVFRNIASNEGEGHPYPAEVTDYNTLYAWANDKCTPLVREITFENAEELTEEGLPFLILFHRPDDMESVKVFENEVKRQIIHERNSINAVHADGLKFSHPLNHLGKSASDLPILAIDSFRHMYLFPDYKKLTDGHSLKQFVIDLHSGKLHREFHNGPDPTEAPKIDNVDSNGNHLPNTLEEKNKDQRPSTPPESVFIKLAPSPDRYSIKRYDNEL